MSKKKKRVAQGGYSRVKYGITIGFQDFGSCEVRLMRDLVAHHSRDYAARALDAPNKKLAFAQFAAAYDAMQTANLLDEAVIALEDLEPVPAIH